MQTRFGVSGVIVLATGQQRGGPIGVKYAEGFRQHLGHGYPQDNLLVAELGDSVHCK